MRKKGPKVATLYPRPKARSRRQGGVSVGGCDPEYVECRLCRRAYRIILISHVRYKHQMDLEQYLERFPRSILFSTATRERISENVTEHFERVGRHWTPDRIKEAIGRRKRKREPLNARSVFDQDKALYEAAYGHFGSWDRALRASGLDPREVRLNRRWSKSDILKEIRRLSRSKECVYGSRMLRREYNLVQATAAAFGSWRAGVEAAGVAPLLRLPVRWTKRAVTDRIHERAGRSESLRGSDVYRQDARLMKAPRRLFRESWPELVLKLGYLYPWRVWLSRNDVIRILRRRRSECRGLPTKAVRRQLKHLSAGVRRHFTSWDAALSAARITGA